MTWEKDMPLDYFLPRKGFWWILTKNGIPRQYIDLVKHMYGGMKRNIRTCGGLTVDFPFTIGFAICLRLFASTLDGIKSLIGSIQNKIPWCMLLRDVTKGVNAKLE